jgi:4-hydroxy-2-oxoheptanedioate aldolase
VRDESPTFRLLTVRSRLLAGERLVGLFVLTPSTVTAEVLGGLGLDVLCIDAEHAAFGRDTIQAAVAAAGFAGTPALVRLSGNDPTEIAAALDAGAAGVIVPRVESAAAALAAARAARFPPAGTRGVGPGRGSGYGRSLADYAASANDAVAVGVQIETGEGVAQASEIARVEGVDFVFVGPGDLAASLGVPFGDTRVEPSVASVLAAARAARRPAGIWAATAEEAARRAAAGFQLVTVGSDIGVLVAGVERALAELKAATDGS